MPGFLLAVGSTVQCTHAAPATAVTTNARVLVGGTPAITASDTHTVAGCPFTVPGPKPQPCVTVTWLPATRVLIGGTPAVVGVTGPGPGMGRSAEQAPQGPPMIGAVQARVMGV